MRPLNTVAAPAPSPLIRWWKQTMQPPAPTDTAPSWEQEQYRKAGGARIMLAIVFLTILGGLILALRLQPTPFALIVLGLVAIQTGTALLLNKAGQLIIAGGLISLFVLWRGLTCLDWYSLRTLSS